MAWSVRPAVVEVGRNRRRTAPETEKGTANWRGFRALWLDSLYPEKEGDEVVLLVRSDGEGGDWSGDVMARPTVARSGFTEKKREGGKEVAARGEEKRGEARVSREPRLEEIRGRREWLALGGEDHCLHHAMCVPGELERGRRHRRFEGVWAEVEGPLLGLVGCSGRKGREAGEERGSRKGLGGFLF
jgi:hypothetical protein